MHACVSTCAPMHAWTSADSLQEKVLSFHLESPLARAQVISLGGKHINLLSQLAGSPFLKRRHAAGQQVHGKINIIKYQEMQMKAIVKYYFTPVRMIVTTKTKGNGGKGDPWHTVVNCNQHGRYQGPCRGSLESKNKATGLSSIQALIIHSKETQSLYQKDTRIWVAGSKIQLDRGLAVTFMAQEGVTLTCKNLLFVSR